MYKQHMGVSLNGGTPKSSILVGFSIINHSILGYPYFRKHPYETHQTITQRTKVYLQKCCFTTTFLETNNKINKTWTFWHPQQKQAGSSSPSSFRCLYCWFLKPGKNTYFPVCWGSLQWFVKQSPYNCVGFHPRQLP